MLADALLVVGKDLRVELHSRVALNQVAPFALTVIVLFGFALGPDRAKLQAAAAGLFWIAVLLSSVLAVQRSFAIESNESAKDGLRLSGLDPAGVFFGKAAAVAVELAALELLLAGGVAVVFGARLSGFVVLVASCVLATIGLAAVGTLYGVAATGSRSRETLMPLLFLPVVSPVLLAATKAWQAGLAGRAGDSGTWLGLLAVFAVVYTAVGAVAFDPLLEDA